MLPLNRGLSRALKTVRRTVFAPRYADAGPGLFSSSMVHLKAAASRKKGNKKNTLQLNARRLWCTMWEQTRTLLFIRAASASHDCSPGSDAVVPPREDKREVLKYQGAFAAYPRFTNWAAVFHSPLDISPSLFFRLIAEQPTIPYSK